MSRSALFARIIAVGSDRQKVDPGGITPSTVVTGHVRLDEGNDIRNARIQSGAMFVVMAAAVIGLSSFTDAGLSLYGTVALVYLAVKLGLSMAYRPCRSDAPALSVAVVVPTYNEVPARSVPA